MSRATKKPSTRSTGASPSIAKLYKQFQEKYAAYIAIPSKEQQRRSLALVKCYRIMGKLLYAPAVTIDEMKIKIRVGIWFVGPMRLQNFPPLNVGSLDAVDHWKPPIKGPHDVEYAAPASLRADLRRLNHPAELIDLARKLTSVS